MSYIPNPFSPVYLTEMSAFYGPSSCYGSCTCAAGYAAGCNGQCAQPCSTQVVVSRDGLSAYEVWLSAGHAGTVADYLLSLQGGGGSTSSVAVAVAAYLAAYPPTGGGDRSRIFSLTDKANGYALVHNLDSLNLTIYAFRADGSADHLVDIQPLFDTNTNALSRTTASLIYPQDGTTFTGQVVIKAVDSGGSGGTTSTGTTNSIVDYASIALALAVPLIAGQQQFITVGATTYRKVGPMGNMPAGLYPLMGSTLITN